MRAIGGASPGRPTADVRGVSQPTMIASAPLARSMATATKMAQLTRLACGG